jgi:hypothetical protein
VRLGYEIQWRSGLMVRYLVVGGTLGNEDSQGKTVGHRLSRICTRSMGIVTIAVVNALSARGL